MTRLKHFLPWLLVVTPLGAYSYETGTHELISRNAIARSVLQTDTEVLQNLGIEGGMQQPFPSSQGDLFSIQELIEFGSVAEDDDARVRFHFYNPLTGQGMNAGNFPNQTPSPDWALAAVGTLTGQQNSYWNARQALLLALTHASKTERERNFGVVFQSLGQVVHHLQDMAQPQHVRDDVHCSVPLIGWLVCPLAGLPRRPSHYEAWTNQANVQAQLGPRLDPGFAGYNIASPSFTQAFNTPRRFWSTETGANSPLNGKGIAEFTNRNFVSANTNFDQPSPPNFALPAPDPANTTDLTIGELCDNSPLGCPSSVWAHADATLTFYGTAGRDNYLGVTIPFSATSTESVFDHYLRPMGRRGFALNRFNFDEAYNHLIPRAVAYSAGMINYFFRGKLDMRKDDQGRLRIVNMSREPITGRFALYYDARDGNRYPVAVDQNDLNRDPENINAWRLSIAALNPSQPDINLSPPILFVPPPNTDPNAPLSPKVANEYMLVFSGDMGEEHAGANMIGAVAAKAIKAQINGTLYVKVLRSNFSEAVIKVSKAGTQYLQGGEFNPLENYNRNAGSPNRAYWQAALYKQVEYRPLPFGGNDYTVLAFNIPNVFAGTASFVRGPDGNFVRRFRPISWLAKNTPNGDFEFGFDIQAFEGQSQVSYTRRYVDNGQTLTVQGTIPWPFFSAPPLSNQSGAVYSMPAISSDGLRVSGFIQGLDFMDLSTGNAQEFRQDMVEHVITLTPGVTPSAGLQSLPRQSYIHSRAADGPFSSQVNDFLQNVTLCDGRPSAGSAHEQHTKSTRTVQDSNRTLWGVGAGVSGESRFVEYVWDRKIDIAQDVEENNYPVGCVGGVDNSIRYTGQGDRSALITTSTSIAGTSRKDAVDTSGGFNNFPHDMRAHYDSINTGPPPWVTKPVPRGRTLSLIQPLGDKAEDAIQQEVDFAAGTSPMKFRQNVITFTSVADTSPAGEIFFASEDGKILIHEPLPGGMPKIVLPPDVVRILGALWL